MRRHVGSKGLKISMPRLIALMISAFEFLKAASKAGVEGHLGGQQVAKRRHERAHLAVGGYLIHKPDPRADVCDVDGLGKIPYGVKILREGLDGPG